MWWLHVLVYGCVVFFVFFFFQAEDGIRDVERSRGLGNGYKRQAYAVLNSKFEMSHEAIAKAVGKKRVTISNSLRLLKLPPDIRKSLRKGDISAGHACAILQAKTGQAMNKTWKIMLLKD